METLDQRVGSIKYRGEGTGMIIQRDGKFLASSGNEEVFSDVRDNEGLRDHFDEMLQKGTGYFLTKRDGSDRVFAYTTVPSTGWIVGISVEQSIVFAAVSNLRLTYGILTLLSILIIVFVSLQFSNRITRSILQLQKHASELSKGNLQLTELSVESSDELGSLTEAFNTMSGNLRELIRKMSTTSEQVAAASEELTASAQQSAEASNHVAGTVSEVAEGMDDQLITSEYKSAFLPAFDSREKK